MQTSTEELIKSVNTKLDLLLLDKDELKKIILGDAHHSGVVDDIHEIKKVLKGDPEFQIEGLITKVNRLDELHKKFKYTSIVFGLLISMGGAIGGFITWLVHQGDKAKELVKTIVN